jgi:RNA 2',3'-cyclic 3'-phosphodiesterase
VSDERARLFIALDLPADVRGALSAWAGGHVGGVPQLRLVEPESLHVTLCFLGARPVAEVDDIAATCRAVSGLAAAPLALGDALWLPPRRPRVLTVALVDDAGRLAAVQSELAASLVAAGVYDPETRPFLAHVSVARVRREAHIRPAQIPTPEPLRFSGRHVTLYRSRLGQGPARYEALASTALAS